MTIPLDHTGRSFGRLTAVLRNGTKWLCKCECGNESLVETYSMTSGHTQSCGCLHKEVTSKTNTKHKLVGTRAYNSWASMKQRCANLDNPSYHRYGALGVTYAPEWETFTNFYADMGDRPADMSLDRIDNNGGYCKSNCRWATWTTQANNKRNTVLVEFGGEKKTVSQWAKALGWTQTKLQRRLARGWSVERSLTTP